MTLSNKPDIDDDFLNNFVYGFACGACDTGGGDGGQGTCEHCGGSGIVNWQTTELKQALYHRLAAEAVYVEGVILETISATGETVRVPVEGKAIPLSKLKAIMEIKE